MRIEAVWIVASGALAIVLVMCFVGTFAPWFHDNLAQRAGMFAVVVGFTPRLTGILNSQSLVVSADTSALQMEAAAVGYVGLALFIVGTIYQRWQKESDSRGGSVRSR